MLEQTIKLKRLLLSIGIVLIAACDLMAEPEHVSKLAGTGEAGYQDGDALSAVLNRPHGLAQAPNGIIYFADRGNHQIRYYELDTNKIKTLAGSGTRGFSEGAAQDAAFNQPVAVTVAKDGTVYVADRDNHRIRTIAVNGTVSTLAGDGNIGFKDGDAALAQFNEPYGVVLNPDETKLLVADYLNHAIRTIDLATGKVSTLAGNGQKGFEDGLGSKASFFQPYNITIDHKGDYYIPDQKNHAIRKMTKEGKVTTLAGTGKEGYKDGDLNLAEFNNPTGVAVDSQGMVYVTDRNNHRIRVIEEDEVETVAGSGEAGGVDGEELDAQFNKPLDLIVDKSSQQLIVSEDTGHRLRKIN